MDYLVGFTLCWAIIFVGEVICLSPIVTISKVSDTVDAHRGTTHEIRCVAQNKPRDLSVKWEVIRNNNSQEIASNRLSSNEQKYGLKYEEKDIYTLIVKNIDPTDDGKYLCRVQVSRYVAAQDSVDIRVVERPRINPMFTSSDMTISAANTKVNLSCAAFGIPKPLIKWTRAGNGLMPGGGFVRYSEPSWYDVVLKNSHNDEIWVKNFRMPERTIDMLCTELADDMSPADNTVREPIPLKNRICIGIYTLASCAEYSWVAKTFGVGEKSVHRCLYLLCSSLARRKQKFIRWYETGEAIQIAEEIKTVYGYPQAIGAIDGSHIAITPPKDVLQAVVDNKYKFRDIYCNSPGSAHDASIFHTSPLSTFIKDCMPKHDVMINNVAVPLHILGDPAYPQSIFIQKGYTGRNLTRKEESFNVYHSSARMCVEIAFGRLKSRWRTCQKRMDVDHLFDPVVITACCILHNLCEESKVPVPRAERDMFPQPRTELDISSDSDSRGIRDEIKEFLAATLPLRRPFHL